MKPRIVMIADVRGWAWSAKAHQVQKHLCDHFEIDIVYAAESPKLPHADLYHTFEISQVRPGYDYRILPHVTGITAHVWQTWEQRHGVGTVAAWARPALAFHANSKLLEAEMRQLLHRPIHYTPNGVDAEFFRRHTSHPKTEKIIVGHVGKPNARKGAEIIRSACAIAGVELRIIQNTWKTALSPEQMREFYQGIHVLAVASDMDGTPNPALEAAACGVAIVSNRIGNMPELIVDGVNGVFVERDAKSMADALRQMTVPQAIEFGTAARASIEEGWTWRHQASAYSQMWLDALDEKQKRDLTMTVRKR